MPLMVSTRNDWFSALRLNFTSSRARMMGVNTADSPIYSGIDTTTISVSHTLYHSITARNTNENSRSSTTVMALPVRKLRMFSSSRTRATESPTRRDWKYASGRLSRCRNSRAPSSTSILLLVCANTQVRMLVSVTSNRIAQIRPTAITFSVFMA